MALDGARPMSYYGSDQAALLSLLTYAKTTGKPIRLDASPVLAVELSIDMAGAKLLFDFAGYCVQSDGPVLKILNPGKRSIINQPEMNNITAPWVITRWAADDTWLAPTAIAATLTQSNADNYYQPGVNDGELYAGLTAAQKAQNISAKLYVYGANGLLVLNPSGRHCLYEFDMCNRVNVVNPQITAGGKGQFGTILFTNMQTTGYGVENFVRGGFVQGGTNSCVTFMRNKRGGVVGGFVPSRCGESGVKTYQNEVGNRSTRCYGMIFNDIAPDLTLYDGVDFNADFGDAAERVDDFPLADYAWNKLPTGHKVSNIKATRCNGIGVWGDGQFNEYTNVTAVDCVNAGVYLRVTNTDIKGASVRDCNRMNSTGVHQIIVEGPGNRLDLPRVHTTAVITAGYAIYTTDPSTETTNERCTGTRTGMQISRGDTTTNNMQLGTSDATQNAVTIHGRPRGVFVNNSAADLTFVLSNSTPGQEQGYGMLLPRDGGVLQKGVLAFPQAGGHLQGGVMNAYNSAYINPGYFAMYEQDGLLKVAYKLANGTVKIGTLTP